MALFLLKVISKHSNRGWLYERLSEKKFQDALYDYYFLDCKTHAASANDVLNIQFLLNAEMVTQIQDCLALRKSFKGEDYEIALKEYESLVSHDSAELVAAMLQPAVAQT